MKDRPTLLDVDTLIALTWPNHVHHHAAGSWFAARRGAGWATCPLTQCAFVRISSNSEIIKEAVAPAHARAILRELEARPGHQFWYDDIDFAAESALPLALIQGYRQITGLPAAPRQARHPFADVTSDERATSAAPAPAECAPFPA